ncbi:sensor histidine kinase [Aureimonas glaciei]|uniref:Histidine kinase n=1 Tax=Aureimonas glaciei TaxID=1776957 RepID=A0A917DDW8_9HYPH|nr:ATP-binding protein [Aureimonas glaciei]GGD32308.1 histidine kinase [Aureimonas glaciei]
MTSDVLPNHAPAAEAGRRRMVVAYLLLQALAALACAVILTQTPPIPPERYRIAEAMFSVGDAPAEAVALPHETARQKAPALEFRYDFQFEHPSFPTDDAWSIFVPRFASGVEIALNGAVLADSRRDPLAARLDRNTPLIVSLPSPLLRDGRNDATLRLFTPAPLGGFLSAVYVGPDAALRPAFEQRLLIFVTLPLVLTSCQAMLAAILAVMWLKRRREPAYGALAAAMITGVVQAVAVPPDPSSFAAASPVLTAAPALEGAWVLLFLIYYLGMRPGRWIWLAFLPGVLLALLCVFAGPDVARGGHILLGLPAVGLFLVLISAVTAWRVLRHGDADALLLSPPALVVLIFWGHDMLSLSGVLADTRIFLARLSYSAFVVAIGAGLTWRFANALNAVDGFAERLRQRVREAETELEASLRREESRARLAALGQERMRLMRDLHDGLGGHLVSMVALSEKIGAEGDRIRGTAALALSDLRNVIDAMDDVDGDIMLILGAWRERVAARLRAHGMGLDWQLKSPSGLPLADNLEPRHVIHILRLLEEAVTNAVKHSGASLVRISLETVDSGSEPPHGRIVVEDEGRGFAMPEDPAEKRPPTGRGLASMRQRAFLCGVRLTLSSDGAGTRVILDLPARFVPTA